jgi:hypothetical protein
VVARRSATVISRERSGRVGFISFRDVDLVFEPVEADPLVAVLPVALRLDVYVPALEHEAQLSALLVELHLAGLGEHEERPLGIAAVGDQHAAQAVLPSRSST